VVERRPEKAGVASSILAPGTTRSRHRFFSEEIYFAMSKIQMRDFSASESSCSRSRGVAASIARKYIALFFTA
jgi:hypothetical protein